MKRYTFIAEYRGGTYINQCIAPDLITALSLWVIELDKKIFSQNKRNRLLKEICNSDFQLIPLKDLKNVWCGTFLSGKFFLLLNVIETV